MKKTHILIVIYSVLTFSVSFAQPTNQNLVVLQNVDQYKDFAIDSRTNIRDTNHLINDLKNQIIRAINRHLSLEQNMHITILDVDMAGVVSPSYDARRIRSHIDSSLLAFNYKIFDANGNIIHQDHVVLEERFLDKKSLQLNRFRNSYFKYELVMFSKWLKNLDITQ